MRHWPLLVVCGIALMGIVIMDHPVVDPVNSVVLVEYSDGGFGSGAIIGSQCVLTARHVSDHNDLTIVTVDGDRHRVVRIVKDSDSDMARLYIEGVFDEKPLSLDPAPLKIHEPITVIGTPGDRILQNSVLHGYVVKVDVTVTDYGYDIPAVNLDILDAHVIPGCSGGPVLDRRGRVRAVFIIGCPPLGGAVPVGELDAE